MSPLMLQLGRRDLRGGMVFVANDHESATMNLCGGNNECREGEEKLLGVNSFYCDLTTAGIGGELRGPANRRGGAASNPARGSGELAGELTDICWRRRMSYRDGVFPLKALSG